MTEPLLLLGDCVAVMASMEPDSIDAIVCDPPYDLTSGKASKARPIVSPRGFMGKDWDGTGVAFDVATWREAFRVLKPGGHVLAFGGTRTVHRMVCAIEDAGFEVRDLLMWGGASGFPKSHDVSKAIDKAAGATREVVGTKMGQPGYSLATTPQQGVAMAGNVDGSLRNPEAEVAITAPATPEAERWAGWGTALKPAWEPICMARKPLASTVAGNVLQYGTGALNIGATRIPGTMDGTWGARQASSIGYGGTEPADYRTQKPVVGRWPANVVLTEVERSWYVVQDDIPSGTREAVHAYYGAGEALRALREAVSRDAFATRETTVLLEGLRRGEPTQGPEGAVDPDYVPTVREGVRGDASVGAVRAPEVLLADVSGLGDGGGGKAGHPAYGGVPAGDAGLDDGAVSRPELSRMEGRPLEGQERVRLAGPDDAVGGGARDSRTDGVEAGQGPVLRPGAPTGDGDAVGAAAAVARGGASPQRGEGRQLVGEPVPDGPVKSHVGTQAHRPGGGATPGASRGVGVGERRLEVPRDLIPEGWQHLFRYSHTSFLGGVLDGGWDGVVGGGKQTSTKTVGPWKPRGAFPIDNPDPVVYGDSGTYSRFFLIPKANRREREPDPEAAEAEGLTPDELVAAESGPVGGGRSNDHPTVKPVELMRHLVRLVTPPGGRVLDPFNGSGTTGLAAMLEGFEYTGIEQDPHYGAISRARWNSPRWVERAEVHRAERAGEPPPVKVSKAKAKRVAEGQEPLWETMPDGQS